jgi:hypothetical protein
MQDLEMPRYSTLGHVEHFDKAAYSEFLFFEQSQQPQARRVAQSFEFVYYIIHTSHSVTQDA